ncbi:MAG TPA: hypothetical protein ENG91_05350 [Desulfobacteraceae bacterium]|nr:hypothetical protein [Desulfobacteraceae bacterium]
MNGNARKISYLSFAASLIITIQMIIILFRGQAACLNEGCRIIENLAVIPPLYFNLLGFIYFQVIFWTIFMMRNRPVGSIDWLKVLLMAGLGVEGVLLAYQIFVAQTLCSYCLVIFTFVLALNIMAGWQQAVAGLSVLAGILLIFSLLGFGPSLLLSLKNQTLNAGTYGIRTCSNPAKKVYLFFSATCPHCQKVLDALAGCNSCDFYFNPVSRLKNMKLAGVKKTPSYSPEVNRLMLALLGIKTVPVLLARDPSGLSIIKGDKRIISYIRQSCYQAAPLPYLGPNAVQEKNMSIYGEEGECSMTIDCEHGAK